MRDDLFSIPIRKYHIDNNEPYVTYANQNFSENHLKVPAPYIFGLSQIAPELSNNYSDILEQFLVDIGLYDTHLAVVTSMILKVLDVGESIDRTDTLPSHYTATHYIKVKDNETSDIFHHPARSLVTAFQPFANYPDAQLDEWQNAAGIYINPGDVIIHPSFLEHSSPKVPDRRITMTLTFMIQENEQGREPNTEELAA